MSDKQNDDKKNLELDHEYDGIKEYDHPLPKWWLITFYATVVFGLGYFFYYSMGKGPTLRDEFTKDMTAHQIVKDKYMSKLQEFDIDYFEKKYADPGAVSYGESLFIANCQSCHAQGGQGDIGPNLTDKYWMFSVGTPETIYPFILSGNLNGMPSWADKLEKDDVYAVLAYVLHQQGKVGNKPKAEQGSEYPPWTPGTRTEKTE
jgi:cytochrome c oxidase cbb3-type subunit 3